jgi:YHS domain-containing protein
MFRFILIEVVLPILFFTLLRAVVRSIFSGVKTAATPQTTPRQSSHVQLGGELKKDPVCGIYVSTAVAVTKNIDGQLVHFCSKECRDKYRAA